MSAGAPTAGQDFVTIEEAARRLGVRERTVYHWCARYREAIAAGHPRRRPDPLRDGVTATASLDAIPDNREVSA